MLPGRKKNWAIGTLIGLGIFVFLVLALNLVLSSLIEEKIRARLKDLGPSIQASFASVRVNLLSSSISLRNLEIKLVTESQATNQEQLFSFRNATIKGIKWFQLTSDNILNARSIELEGGEIHLVQQGLNRIDSVLRNSVTKDHPALEEVSLRRFSIASCDLTMEMCDKRELSAKTTLNLFDIHLFPTSKNDSAAIPFQALDFKLNDLICPVMDSAISIQVKQVSIDSRLGIMEMDSIHIKPNYEKIDYAHKLGHQADRIDAQVARIECVDPDPIKLFRKELKSKEIIIHDARAEIFRDRRVQMKKERRPLPLDYLKDIPLNLVVDKLSLKNACLSYEEFPEDGNKTGTLRIEKLQISITPFMNSPEGKQDHLSIQAESSIMDAGRVFVTMQVPLNSERNYYANGAFKDLKLVSLNEPATNLGGFHIESGTLDQLTFEFSMSSEKSSGKIIGEYHELVIDKLKKDEHGKKKPDALKSFALKHLIIPKNKDKSFPIAKRTGKVDYKRDPYRNFSNYLLHSLLSGIKASFDLGFLLP